MEEGVILSLLDSMAEECRYMNHIREDDEVGSSVEYWTEGSKFLAAIIKDATTEAIIAEREGIKEIFTVVVKKGVALDFHDVFKRVSDGQIFRVTGTTADNAAPEASTVRIAKVTAEKWVLTNA
jgi:hypothetical protein